MNLQSLINYGCYDSHLIAVKKGRNGPENSHLEIEMTPVDMSSFYIGKNFFELFTEQDSIPLLFRFPSTVRELEKTRLDQLAAAGHDPSAKTAFNLSMHVSPVEFYSAYYTVRSNGEYLRGAWVGRAESPSRYYISLKVFAEIW